MKKFTWLLSGIMLLFVTVTSQAQINRLWVGGANGTWSVGTNWSPSGTPTGNDTATISSNTNISLDINLTLGGLRITNNASVILDAPASRDVLLYGTTQNSPALWVDEGSTLTMLTSGASGAFHMAFASSAKAWINGTLICRGNSASGDARLEGDVAGTNRIYINGTYLSDLNSGNLIGDTRNLFFNAGSTYQLNDNGGLVPNAFYDSLSLIKITGTKNSPPTFLTSGFSDKYYGSILYDGSQQTADINLSISTSATYKSILKGSFDILSTNGRQLNLATNLRNFYVWNNFNVSGGSYVNMGNGSITQMWVTGDLSIDNGCTLYMNLGFNVNETDSLSIGGDIFIDGTLISSKGYLNLNGTNGKQSITSQQGALFGVEFDVVINNPAGINLLSDFAIPHSLYLKNGIVETGPLYSLFMNGDAASIWDASSKSHIKGNLIRSTNTDNSYYFAVGDGLRFRPVEVEPCCSSATSYQVSYVNDNPYISIGSAIAKPLTGISNTEYWKVRGSGKVKLIIPLDGAVSASPRNPIESDTLMVAAWNSSANEWEQVYNADGIIYPGSSTSGQLVSGDLTSSEIGTIDSKYTIAFRADILPIRLLSFKALLQNNSTALQWITDGLEANGFFEVMKSNDGRNFFAVQQIKTIKGQTSYQHTDNLLQKGIQFYQLKMTDGDGKITYSEVAAVSYNGKAVIRIQPNPVRTNAILVYDAVTAGTITLKIFSSSGQLTLQQNSSVSNGENKIELNMSNLPAGNYQVQVVQNGNIFQTVPLIKQ